MKTIASNKHRVTPFNIRTGAKAPYFVVDVPQGQKRDETHKMAREEFKDKSSLSKYDNWNLEIEKV